MRLAWSPTSASVGQQANTHGSAPQHWEEPHPESRSAADSQDSPYGNAAWERATNTTVQVTSRWLNRGVPMLAPPAASSVGVRVIVPLDSPSASIPTTPRNSALVGTVGSIQGASSMTGSTYPSKSPPCPACPNPGHAHPIEPDPLHPASASSAPEAYACARAVLTISFPDRVSQLRSAIRFSPIVPYGRRPCRPPVQGLGPRCSR